MALTQWVVCVVLIVLGTAVLVTPAIYYVTAGWRAKRKDIMDGLGADARLAYFEMFSRSDLLPTAATAKERFEQLYSQWYGRRFFLAPGLLLFLVGLVNVTLIVLSVLDVRRYISSPLFVVPETGIAAMSGAYLWVANDLISRARRLDFAPSDVMWGVLRMVTSVPMGYAFAVIAAPALGPFVAFALGAFPLATLLSMLRRLANKKLDLDATADERSDDIIKLQGINRIIVERLANEDITTVTQMAYCDPVRLTMRSSLTFNFLTDCMNQALAWMYLEDDLYIVRPLGLRGAGEIKMLIDDYDNADPARQAAHIRAVAAMPVLAAALKQDSATLQIVFRQIATDPFAIFLQRVWT